MTEEQHEMPSETSGEQKHEHAAAEECLSIKAADYEKLVRELAEAKDKNIRLYAEFDNVRKRFERDKIEFVKYANEGLISEFLSIMDDLDRTVIAANANHQDYQSFLKGVQMVMARIHELLRKNDVKPIEAVGKPFDPHCHEVLMQEPSEQEEGIVLEEFQKGYTLGGKVVRTAKVKVAAKQ